MMITSKNGQNTHMIKHYGLGYPRKVRNMQQKSHKIGNHPHLLLLCLQMKTTNKMTMRDMKEPSQQTLITTIRHRPTIVVTKGVVKEITTKMVYHHLATNTQIDQTTRATTRGMNVDKTQLLVTYQLTKQDT